MTFICTGLYLCATFGIQFIVSPVELKQNECVSAGGEGGMGFGMTIFQLKHTVILMLLAFSVCFIVCLCSLATAKHVQNQHAVADLKYPNSKGGGPKPIIFNNLFPKTIRNWTELDRGAYR